MTERYEVVAALDLMVPVRDGVRLATDVYRPASEGAPLEERRPVLLLRTPYNKSDPEKVALAKALCTRGYVVAVQDVRGQFLSEGVFYFLRHEAEDGYDTIEWLGTLPYCDGQVGTLGVSYQAWVQTAAACLNPPQLRAMVVHEGGSNAIAHTVRHHGAYELRFLAWAFWQGATNPRVQRDPLRARAFGEADVRRVLANWPVLPGESALATFPEYERWALDLVRDPTDESFWRRPGVDNLAHVATHADVPVLHLGGWYDSYTRATTELYTALRDAKSSPQLLVMGPWVHGHEAIEWSHAGEVEFGPAAILPYVEEHLAFFNWALRGGPDYRDRGRVRLFVMGGGSGQINEDGRLEHGGQWRVAPDWPPPGARQRSFYLHGDGTLRDQPPATEPESPGAATSYLFDPANPVPTIGGGISSLVGLRPPIPGKRPLPLAQREHDPIGEAGGFDQVEREGWLGCTPPFRPLAERPDVLVYQTEPLAEDLTVAGPVEVELYVATDGPDTDFTAKLIDLYPADPAAGRPHPYALNLTDSIVRGRYHRDLYHPELLEPGRVYCMRFALYPTANRFLAEHHIRLDVSSSNFPRFDVNPNTGDPLWTSRARRTATNTLYHDRTRPSRLMLTVLPE